MIRLRSCEKTFLITVFTVMALFLYYISLKFVSNNLNIFGVIFLGIAGLFVFTARGGWIFLLYAFGLTFALLSCALTELTGAFLIEIQEAARLTGAAARNSFLATFFLVTSYAAYRLFLDVIPTKLPVINTAEPIAARLLLTISFSALIYIAAVLAIYGSPIFMGIDRFNYLTNVAPAGYGWVYGNIPLLGFVVALSGYKDLIRHSTSLIWLALAVAVYIIAGEKFSKIFLLVFFFFLPYYIINSPAINARHVILCVIGVAILGVVVVFNYMAIYGSTEILIHRLALQGQMIYALDMEANSAQPVTSILKNFAGIGAPEVDRGLIYLMYLVAPSSVVDFRIGQGATFTAPFPANISYFFGAHLSPFIVIIFSVVLGGFSALVNRATESGNVILSGLAVKGVLLVYISIMMGSLDYLIDIKALFYIFAIVIYLIVVRVHIDGMQHKTNFGFSPNP